jgi:hypothetical protein
MTKKDKINCLLMAPFLLTLLAACLGAVVMLLIEQPLGLIALAVFAAFVTGAIRFMEI